jgi:alkylated DNA repair protein alkB homolog 8
MQLDQLTVNKYPAGIGLAPHVDAHSAFSGAITSLSLGSAAVMEFRRGGNRKSLLLPRRSLVVMAHESRYAWCVFVLHSLS